MSGRADSDTGPEIPETDAEVAKTDADVAGRNIAVTETDAEDAKTDAEAAETDADAGETDAGDTAEDARRARWTAAGTGALLTLAGLAAALLRLTRSVTPLVPAAYAGGAAVCALATVLGSRGRTRRALWLLIAGVMAMALGDQFD
ncbi:hypothetical protein ABZ499_22630 [Streptomyces sp. NPDC019990]|uniref:hypothetical protein n=1 Tax=Streptomyces sp. NPDC019990 TaxID=3154693 RepID=UPI0033DD5357